MSPRRAAASADSSQCSSKLTSSAAGWYSRSRGTPPCPEKPRNRVRAKASASWAGSSERAAQASNRSVRDRHRLRAAVTRKNANVARSTSASGFGDCSAKARACMAWLSRVLYSGNQTLASMQGSQNTSRHMLLVPASAKSRTANSARHGHSRTRRQSTTTRTVDKSNSSGPIHPAPWRLSQ